MRHPLHDFAARLVRCQEVAEFVTGLVKEFGVDPSVIVKAATGRSGPGHSSRRDSRGHLPPLPGADPHDPNGGHNPFGESGPAEERQGEGASRW